MITFIFTILIFFASTVVIVVFVSRYVRKSFRHERELLAMEMEVQEQTRRNLASDLHDNIGQLLSLTNVTLGSINLADPGRTQIKLQEVQQLVERSVRELRQLSKVIHGETVLHDGLVAAIAQEIGWLERNGFYQVEFVNDTETLTASHPEKDLFIYRMVQETLNNAIKHSSADRLGVVLRYEAGHLTLEVRDNGTGFDVAAAASASQGLGLSSMRKRVDLLGGTFDIRSSADAGTCVTIQIPYPNLTA